MSFILNTFLPSFISALLLTFIFTGVIRKLALKLKILSKPRQRDMHSNAIPRLGGVAIVLVFVLVLLVTAVINPDLIFFSNEYRFGFDRHIIGLIAGSLVLLMWGIADDVWSLKPSQQFLGQALAAIIIIFSGIGIDYITNPFGAHGAVIQLNQITFNLFQLGDYTASITLWSDLFTFVWLIGMMNVMNWFDGLDGLATGVSAISATMLLLLSLAVGSPAGIIAMLVVLIGALIGFLPWNWYPAKIFMGTAGSTFLGFVLGVAAIISGGKIATALLVLGVPVLDALWVVFRRIMNGQSIFLADRKHLHHRLVDAGLTVPKAVFVLYIISFIFGALALYKNNTNIKLQLAFVLSLVVIIIGLGTWAAEKAKKQTNGKKKN